MCWNRAAGSATIPPEMLSPERGLMTTDKDAIRVLIAGDHQAFAEALKTVIDLERGRVVTEVVPDGPSVIERVSVERPDVIVVDAQMPEMDGIAATREIRRLVPDARVLVLSPFADDLLVARAVEAGATGLISTGSPISDVAQAVFAAHAGEPLIDPAEAHRALEYLQRRREEEAAIRARVERLTPRQVQILQLMADGMRSEEIAESLGISPHTLRTHVQNILTKLGVHSKLQAVTEAIRHGKVEARRTTV
jgi:DNA-binding NarL/FixJ family response regulator